MINHGDDEVSFLSKQPSAFIGDVDKRRGAQQAGRVGLQMTLGTEAPDPTSPTYASIGSSHFVCKAHPGRLCTLTLDL